MEKIKEVKAYWDARPCNRFHSLEPVGTKEYFNEVEAKKYFVEPHILTFAEFDKWKGKKVLEIGCGMGTAVISFARAGAHVTAIDLSETSLELCRQRLRIYGLEANIYLGNAEELNTIIPVEKYDLIYSFGVIHHSPHPERIIAQLPQYLKPEGELRCMLYSLYSYKSFDMMHRTNNWDMGAMRKVIQYYSEAQEGSPVTFVYAFDEIKALLAPHFEVVKMWKDHVFIWNIDEYKKGKYIRTDAFKTISDSDLRVMERELGWHTLVVAKLA